MNTSLCEKEAGKAHRMGPLDPQPFTFKKLWLLKTLKKTLIFPMKYKYTMHVNHFHHKKLYLKIA